DLFVKDAILIYVALDILSKITTNYNRLNKILLEDEWEFMLETGWLVISEFHKK
ncbi:8544_t:CDS:1, partial [Entrophospora sp. SA101]